MIEYMAMLTMLIDHIGILFFGDNEIFRIIGRLAFPLYAFGILQGYRLTKNRKLYHKRLLILALLSQIPFMIAFNTWNLNVIFTFLICFYVLYALDHLKKIYSIPILIILGLVMSTGFDYGLYGLILVLIYRYSTDMDTINYHLLLNLVYMFFFDWWIQMFSLIGTIIIQKREKLLRIRPNKAFYRAFYPFHLVVLILIKGGL